MIAYASSHTGAAQGLVDSLRVAILNPLIALLMGVAVLVFLWGAFQYIYGASNGEARQEGRQHMIWGIIGLSVGVGVL